MIDLHYYPERWGIRPVLFNLSGYKISSYSFFVLLGLTAGLVVYFILAGKEQKTGEKSFHVLAAGLAGGIIGAKIPIWILNFSYIIQSFPDIMPFLSGRTITGGLIGGTLSVMYIKKKFNIQEKKGNLFAPAIALGVSIGRIGCLLRGCCYGLPTNLPWGVDFGDGILRHPTQIYESVFMFCIFLFLCAGKKRALPGYLFFLLMNIYFVFRFFEEFLRANPLYWKLTLFQYISIGALLFINIKYLKEKI